VVKVKRKTRKKFSCDFETTTDPNDCRVWAYAWMEIGNTKNTNIGNSLDEFMDWVEGVKADLYFHNLKFDGSFMVGWLLRNGYTWNNEKNPPPKSFSTIISRMGQWYMIDICYSYRGKIKLHTCIYDSLKKLPFQVKVIGKSFKLDVQKGDLDYAAYRPVNHVITHDEKKYINNDVEIIAQALDIQFKQGLTHMTSGSDSLNGFKDVISKNTFKSLFPVLNLKADKDIRLAYRGGFTWVNEKFKGVEVGEGLVYDVNSLYPSVMYDRPLAWGTPSYFDGQYEEDSDYPLYIQHIACEFELKEGYIPTIQIKDPDTRRILMCNKNDYLHSSHGEKVELFLTNIDLELIREHYHLYNVTYIDGIKFMSKIGIFKGFIDKWMYIKNNSKGAIKQLAKLMLNSLY
jgi:hypothetical protein